MPSFHVDLNTSLCKRLITIQREIYCPLFIGREAISAGELLQFFQSKIPSPYSDRTTVLTGGILQKESSLSCSGFGTTKCGRYVAPIRK
jgi:hypothetical protein